ncbi:hypothetical protein EPN16_01840 [bacterium]|nr:MAG: hypothetical protein EPN16_01840 [bacterium]
MRRVIVVSWLAVFLCISQSYAQEVQKSAPRNPEKSQQAYKQMQENYQQGFKRVQEEMRKRQEQELEQLKQTNPQVYQERKGAIERQDKFRTILSDFQAGKLTAEQAESQLFPLMKSEMRYELEGLNERIASLEKQLDLLKKAKQDPDLFVRHRVRIMLGKEKAAPQQPPNWGY